MGAGACSSYVVSWDGATVLLDCGSGTLPLLLERSLATRLDAIVISHMHRDHMWDLLPLADLAVVGALYPRTPEWKKPRLFVPTGGIGTLVALNDIWYKDRKEEGAEDGPEPSSPSLRRLARAFDLEEYGEKDRLEIGGLTATFRRTHHGPGPCYSPRVTNGHSTIVYSADAGYEPELAGHARGADLLLCEATFSESHPYWTEKHGHMTGEEAGRLAREAGVGRLVLTHLGPDPDVNAANLVGAKARFAGTVDLARTGSVFHL